MHFLPLIQVRIVLGGENRASKTSQMSFWWQLHPAASGESHFTLPGHLRDGILSVLFGSFSLVSFQSAFTFFLFSIQRETPEQHPCQVQLAPLSAEEQLDSQVLLDFWASRPLTEIVPAACWEASLRQLGSLFLFFQLLVAISKGLTDITHWIYIESCVDKLFIYLHKPIQDWHYCRLCTLPAFNLKIPFTLMSDSWISYSFPTWIDRIVFSLWETAPCLWNSILSIQDSVFSIGNPAAVWAWILLTAVNK